MNYRIKNPVIGFSITDTRADGRTQYVAAPVGWYRKADGTLARDGTPSPEMTDRREHAHVFASHRSAARNSNLIPGSRTQFVTA